MSFKNTEMDEEKKIYHLRYAPLPHLLQLVLLAKLTFPHLKIKAERDDVG